MKKEKNKTIFIFGLFLILSLITILPEDVKATEQIASIGPINIDEGETIELDMCDFFDSPDCLNDYFRYSAGECSSSSGGDCIIIENDLGTTINDHDDLSAQWNSNNLLQLTGINAQTFDNNGGKFSVIDYKSDESLNFPDEDAEFTLFVEGTGGGGGGSNDPPEQIASFQNTYFLDGDDNIDFDLDDFFTEDSYDSVEVTEDGDTILSGNLDGNGGIVDVDIDSNREVDIFEFSSGGAEVYFQFEDVNYNKEIGIEVSNQYGSAQDTFFIDVEATQPPYEAPVIDSFDLTNQDID
ncbi:MAG: hypothetical protein ACLFVR_16255, partial [Thiohalospira sp.]